MTKKRGPLALIIIDGWGYSASREGNAIALATHLSTTSSREKYPQHCSKRTARASVCLPA
jgi:bisphosphoglycerate-independent phosphoglycerate mutase (AlkP superfamily)